MKIAIISDIHGNLEALKTTFEDIQKRNVDKIICLGDIIMKGVHSKECIQLVKEKCDIVLRGNCDRHFSQKHENLEQFPKQEQKRMQWMRETLSEEDREYLYNLPYCYEFYMSGSLVRLFHAMPDVDNKAVLNLDSIETKLKMFYPTTQINYLIIEGEFGSKEYNSEISYQFIRVPYNIQKELEDEYLNIEKENYRFEILEGKYRNMTKINENYKSLGIDPGKI